MGWICFTDGIDGQREMTLLKKPIGLFGGTFDPIHRGHLQIAENLLQELHLHAVHFIPNKQPIHRPQPEASPQHRLAMVRIATAKYSHFIVNDVEINRPGPSYTIDTLRKIRQQIPQQPLCLILGTDAFCQINTWHDWQEIPELCHLVIINRPGAPLNPEHWMKDLFSKRETKNLDDLGKMPSGKIFQYEIFPMNISATEIRNKIKLKQDLTKELPSSVIRYIQQHHLYK